jgi:large subunit ribosomal protein L21
MFAVVKTGGKQYRVQKDSVIRVEKIDGDEGAMVDLKEVLLIEGPQGVLIGRPVLLQAKVEAQIVKQMRDRKVLIFKKKRRTNYRRKKGHRQHLTVLKIVNILDS